VGEVFPTGRQDTQTVDDQGRPVLTGIDGVIVRYQRRHADHRGTLSEVVNFDDPFWTEPIVYSYFLTVRPGRIKGWGMHRRQHDRYFLGSGSVRVVLHDGRADSPTFGRFQELEFTEATPGLLHIPAGVWHADQNWGDSDAVIVNFPTRAYDRDDPDKFRIDPHSGEIPFDWSLPDG
jgi:dTDP-4-dehydrorhamnose 3,5-epimerase